MNVLSGKFSERDLPDYSGRDWTERAFTIGIGGYVDDQPAGSVDWESHCLPRLY